MVPRDNFVTMKCKSQYFMSINYPIKPVNNFSNKNQKDKETFFIFLMKKPRWLYDEN